MISMPKRKHRPNPTDAADRGERLQKVLAAAGLGSRRQCEELIVAGRVEIDGEVADELGTRVHPDEQEIRVDGEKIRLPKKVCYAVNKPSGVLCTNRDPQGRTRVIDLVPPTDQHLFTVGRLDKSSEGLILVTNDGDLAQKLTHPSYGVPKVYRVQVAGTPEKETLRQLTEGVHLSEGVAKVASYKIIKVHKQSTDLELVLEEGRNRVVRRLLANVGHKVLSLRRVAIGPLKLQKLPPGTYRTLNSAEIRQLKAAAQGGGQPAKGRKKSKRKGKQKPLARAAAGKKRRGRPGKGVRKKGSRKGRR